MTVRDTVFRGVHDVGLAAWFGGSLMGAVGLNGASQDVEDPRQRLRVASAGWGRWSPVNAAAIGAHLIGSVGLLAANRARVRSQAGVGASSAAKTVLTGAALAVTAYSGALGRKLAIKQDVPVEGGAVPAEQTPPDVATWQQHQRACQWLIPALTGGISVINAVQGEQQRPGRQAAGIALKARRRLEAAV